MLRLPTASAGGDGVEEQDRDRLQRLADELRQRQAHELAHRRSPARPRRSRCGTSCPRRPMNRLPRWMAAPDDRADAPPRRSRADRERQRPDHDPGVVEQRRDAVPEVALLGEQHLPERQRRGEQDLRDEHQPEQVDVQVPLGADEARRDEPTGRLGEDEEHHRTDAHDGHAERQDHAAESVGLGGIGPASQADEDRDEGRRQAGLDQDVEQELRQLERGVVGVELRAGAEGAREDPVAQQPHQVAAEEEDREDRRAARHEARDQRHARGSLSFVATQAFGDRVEDRRADRSGTRPSARGTRDGR